jgi:hypothetical protein
LLGFAVAQPNLHFINRAALNWYVVMIYEKNKTTYLLIYTVYVIR